MAKNPTEINPHAPQKKWTGAASTGSSMRSLRQVGGGRGAGRGPQSSRAASALQPPERRFCKACSATCGQRRQRQRALSHTHTPDQQLGAGVVDAGADRADDDGAVALDVGARRGDADRARQDACSIRVQRREAQLGRSDADRQLSLWHALAPCRRPASPPPLSLQARRSPLSGGPMSPGLPPMMASKRQVRPPAPAESVVLTATWAAICMQP